MHIRVKIGDNLYSSYDWFNWETGENIDCDKDPLALKLFSEDIIIASNSNIILSPVRNKTIPGVLMLTGKTYGIKKKKKFYKCCPDDKSLPAFLVPFSIKYNRFEKAIKNKYILFKYLHWDNKHPEGIIIETLGTVDNLSIYYEYQLYCKGLHISLKQFNKATSTIFSDVCEEELINSIMQKWPSIEDRTGSNHPICSIDPRGSMDFDDAIGYLEGNNGEKIISIYIADVPLWLDYLDLWDNFSQKVATIYLPDYKRSMLPTILSDRFCSLQANKRRLAFTLDIKIIDTIKGSQISSVRFLHSLIKVSKNYVYEEQQLLNDKMYRNIFENVERLCKNHKYLDMIQDSHDLVSYLMIVMNHYSSIEMSKYKNGIYRSMTVTENTPTNSIPNNVNKFLNIWKYSTGGYNLYNDNKRHDLVGGGLDTYLHITSPIRRLVDLLNIIQLQENLDLLQLSNKASQFYTWWINKLDYINETMKAIRKIQTDSSLLSMCVENPDILQEIYEGCILDVVKRTDIGYQYTVYLPKLKIVSRIKLWDIISPYTIRMFKLYMFKDEIYMRRKIRLELCGDVLL